MAVFIFLTASAWARIIVAVSPSVLLMDEPASALDPISTAKVEELIHELKKEYTIVIVTHNMQQAARVSDKTAFFYMGNMVEYDDTKKIFTNPGKEATQNYITPEANAPPHSDAAAQNVRCLPPVLQSSLYRQCCPLQMRHPRQTDL